MNLTDLADFYVERRAGESADAILHEVREAAEKWWPFTFEEGPALPDALREPKTAWLGIRCKGDARWYDLMSACRAAGRGGRRVRVFAVDPVLDGLGERDLTLVSPFTERAPGGHFAEIPQFGLSPLFRGSLAVFESMLYRWAPDPPPVYDVFEHLGAHDVVGKLELSQVLGKSTRFPQVEQLFPGFTEASDAAVTAFARLFVGFPIVVRVPGGWPTTEAAIAALETAKVPAEYVLARKVSAVVVR
ncbi:MAG: hypothetical protein U0610_15930 [bacterium]